MYGERGSALVPGVVAIAMLMVLVAGAFSYSMDEYARGAVRTAVDDAAEAGADSGGSVALCYAEATTVMDNLLHGSFASAVKITCADEGAQMIATGSGSLPTLLPALPRLTLNLTGFALVQAQPQQ